MRAQVIVPLAWTTEQQAGATVGARELADRAADFYRHAGANHRIDVERWLAIGR
jgi:hypothetical protein